MVDAVTVIAAAERVVGAGAAAVQSRWQAIMEAAKRGDASEVMSLVQQLQDELGTWKAALEEPLGYAAEHTQPYSDGWWQHRFNQVAQRLQTSGEAAFEPWLLAYVDALIIGDGPALDALAETAPEISADAVATSRIAAALANRQDADALSGVHELLRRDARRPQRLLDSPRRAAMLVLAGRLCLALGWHDSALLRFRKAEEVDPSQPRVAVGLGQYYAARGEEDEALAEYRRALDLAAGSAVESADQWLALGAAAAQEESWEEAEEWYGRAVQAAMVPRYPDGALGALLAPADGNAFLRLGQELAEKDREAALRAADRALALGVTMRDGNAARHAYELKARLTPDTEAAAASWFKAGRLSAAAGEDDRAIALLERAREAGYGDALVYWELADSRRIAAGRIEDLLDPRRRTLLESSISAWAEGCSVRAAAADEAWAHISAAFAHDALADSDEADELRLRWRAIALLERALRLDPENPIAWTQLARILRLQDADVCALEASKHAVGVDESPAALSEWGAALINVGLPEEARQVAERVNEVSPGPYASLLLSFVDVHTGHAAAARNRLLEIEPADDPGGGVRSLRAYCARRTGDRKAALEDYRSLRADSGAPADLQAIAAYQLDEFDRAIELLAPRSAHSEYEERLTFLIGLCHLAIGDLEVARSLIQTAFSYPTAAIALADSRFELEELNRRLAERPDAGDQRVLIEELLDQVNSVEPQDPHALTAEAELRRLLGAPRLAPDAPMAIHASLARLALRAGRWKEAAVEHQEWDRLDEAPEARLGAEQSVMGILNGARGHVAVGNLQSAAEELDRAEQVIAELSLDTSGAAGVLNALRAMLAVAEHDSRATVAALRRAVEVFRAGPADPAAGLVNALRGSWPSHAQLWDLLRALKDGAAELSEAADVLREARAVLIAELGRSYQFDIPDLPSELDHRPRVQLGSELVPADTSASGPLFAQYVPAMRERVRGDLGIVVPGIQFESDLELPRRGYAILLQDFPVQMGVLPEGASYCYGDAARVEGAADGDAILLKQAHPVTGAPGAWIRDTALRGLTAAQIWRDPILFVVAELEAVLRRNAADFLVFDYIDGLIEDWALDDRAAQIVDEVLAAPAARVQFAWAARASIAEGVPLTDGPAILAGYRTGLFAGRGDDEILRQMRLAVLDKLPGRDENASRILLPADLEEELSEALPGADGDGVSLSPVRAFEIVGRIRQLLEAAQPRTALVTSSPHARPLLRRLICAEFPDVAVLSTEELDPETPMSSLAIEKDATPHSPVIEETADRV